MLVLLIEPEAGRLWEVWEASEAVVMAWGASANPYLIAKIELTTVEPTVFFEKSK